MGANLTEPRGALRTLFIQRTPDRTEMDGVATLLDWRAELTRATEHVSRAGI